MKVSKVVMIVVALHVLVIGGIFVFEGCSRARVQTPAVAENETPIGEAVPPDLNTLAPPLALDPNALVSVPPGPLTPAIPDALAPAPFAPPAAATYAVKKGDSLWKIANAQGVTVAELSKANNLTTKSVLKIGQQLTIPAKAAPAAPALALAPAAPALPGAVGPAPLADPTLAAAATQSYTVKKGDSLWKIANSHHVSVAALKQANGLSRDVLKIGQTLKLPATAAAAPVAGPATTTAAGPAPAQASVGTWNSASEFREPGTYTVNGQTLHFVDLNETPAIIAKKYGIKTDELMKANNLTDPRQINYGQRLVIPVAGQPQAAAPVPLTTASATIH